MVQPLDGLTQWLYDQAPSRFPTASSAAADRLRFVFYGRVSTPGSQEVESSHGWQRENAERLIAGSGRIVRDVFDAGYSRSLDWPLRPGTRALLDLVADPARDFDAVGVGEYERGFSGDQLLQLLPHLRRHGVSVWIPEFGGPVDAHDPTHQALIRILGHQAQREVLRARFRTTAAMRIQVRDHGRHIGGRPPYGYRTVDAGPHPNPAHARWGRRLLRLDPDPVTAVQVQWMFAQRLAGHSVAVITAELNDRGVTSPAGTDPDRNPHRDGSAWSSRAVAAILANPRYTGRQVWNRHRIDHQEAAPGQRVTAEGPIRRANRRDQWVVSTGLAHPALVNEQDFVAVQRVTARPQPHDDSQRRYLLVGLVLCAICGRRAESQWAHGRPAYRCRHGQRGARPADSPQPMYWREDRLIRAVAAHLDLHTGQAQTFWQPAEIADYLRTHQLIIRADRDDILLEGPTPASDPRIRGATTTKESRNATPGSIPKRRIIRKFVAATAFATPRRGLRVRGGN